MKEVKEGVASVFLDGVKKERINGIQKVRLAGTVKFGPPDS
jgi:hypothetical protein